MATPEQSSSETTPIASINTASESRFNVAHFSEPLTAFTVGWKDPENIADFLEFIAPTITVGRRFEFKKASNAEAFLSEVDDVRAIGSSFKRVEYTGSSVNEKTLNKGLTIRIDHDEITGSDWQERYVEVLLQRLHRNELRRTLALIDSVAKSSDLIWNKEANPDATIREALNEATGQSGIRPNRILFGESAWDLRSTTYESKDRPFSTADLSPKELAQKLLVDEIRILRARFNSATGSKSGPHKPMLANSLYTYYARNTVTKDEPSNIKRFVTPTDTGTNFRVYIQENAKYTDIAVEHYSNIVITSEIGIQKLVIKES